MSLKLYMEPVTPTGGHKSEGVQNLLGRPPMNWISVVLREAVQNSWDARQGDVPVEFELHWRRPDKDQRIAMRDQIFTNEPTGAGIREALQKTDFDILMLTDRGTKGLNGPILANDEPEAGEKRNFVDFVWEIGRSEAVGPGGGTYGYGKTSFYRLSRIRTVCIYTRTHVKGKIEDRFIAATLGKSSPKHTGRSWWGLTDSGGIRPLVGTGAMMLATQIGMPAFTDGQCGTTILMLCPRMEDLTRADEDNVSNPAASQVTRTIGESLVQWFWPKMVAINGNPPAMIFRLFHDGAPVAIPDPEVTPPFNAFVEALCVHAAMQSSQSIPSHAQAFPIACGQPRAALGDLVVVKRAKKNRKEGSGEFGESSLRDLYEQAHHVVLLRKPMLVVKYLKCLRPPSDKLDCAGVFILNSNERAGDVEKAFALSEPATHDDWIPESLENPSHKTFVRVAIRNIKHEFNEFVAPNSQVGSTANQTTLGAFSEMLGDLLAGSTDGTGARVRPATGAGKKGGGFGGVRTSRIELDGMATVAEVDNHRCLRVPFRVVLATGVNDIHVRAAPVVLLEQGTEKEPPKNAITPRVHSFCRIRQDKEVDVFNNGATVHITSAKAADRWVVKVIIPEESRVRVDLIVVE